MIEIVPAILPKSYRELEEKLDVVASAARSEGVAAAQIDICDGSYVPNRTWPYIKGVDADGAANDMIFIDIVSQEKAMPHWEELDFEFDLMTRDAFAKIPDFISAGASRVVVHAHSMTDDELAAIVREYGDLVEIGVAYMPADDAAAVSSSIAALSQIGGGIHFVQIMGIDRIGFQGQASDRRAIDLVRAVRAAYPDLPISVDGAIGLDDAPDFVSAGADRLVVGSALFESGDFLGTLKRFHDIPRI